jgi:hypothetical protein
VRYLTVLQSSDANVAADPATAIHSIAGTDFDGTWVGNTAVVFPTTLGQAFSSTTYTVPSTITRHMVTGLTPGALYGRLPRMAARRRLPLPLVCRFSDAGIDEAGHKRRGRRRKTCTDSDVSTSPSIKSVRRLAE